MKTFLKTGVTPACALTFVAHPFSYAVQLT